MLFTDFIFIFIYLPIVVAGYFALGRRGGHASTIWLFLASLFFYGWWDYRYVPLLLASIAGNFFVGQRIMAANAAGPDGQEGIASFLEKRPPVWQNR